MAQNKQTAPMFWALVVVIILILLAVLRFGFGITAIGSIIQNMIIWAIVLFVFGLVFYAVYWLFFKPHKIDVTYINKQKLIISASMGKSPLMGNLYLSGDAGHQTVLLGKIVGYCRIQVLDTNKMGQETRKGNEQKDPKKKEEAVYVKAKEQDVIVFKRDSFPMSMIEEPKVLRLDPEDHTDLVGDVKVKGFSLVKLSEYFFLNKDHLDLTKIDYNLLQEAKRGVLFLNLADMKGIVDMALGIDPRHQKEMQKDSMLKIPQAPPSPPAQ